MPATRLLNRNSPASALKMSLPSSFGGWCASKKSAPPKMRMAASAATARFQYVPRRRDAARNSRSTIGRKIMQRFPAFDNTVQVRSILNCHQRFPRRRLILAAKQALEPAGFFHLVALGRRQPEIIQQMAPRPPNTKKKIVRQSDSKPKIYGKLLPRPECTAPPQRPENFERQRRRVKRAPGQNQHAADRAKNGTIEVAGRQSEPHTPPAQSHQISDEHDQVDQHHASRE